MLSFQRLRVYQRAIEFLALVNEVVEQLPRVMLLEPSCESC